MSNSPGRPQPAGRPERTSVRSGRLAQTGRITRPSRPRRPTSASAGRAETLHCRCAFLSAVSALRSLPTVSESGLRGGGFDGRNTGAQSDTGQRITTNHPRRSRALPVHPWHHLQKVVIKVVTAPGNGDIPTQKRVSGRSAFELQTRARMSVLRRSIRRTPPFQAPNRPFHALDHGNDFPQYQ